MGRGWRKRLILHRNLTQGIKDWFESQPCSLSVKTDMTKRQLLIALGPVPLDAIILREDGKEIIMVLAVEPDQYGHVTRVMLTAKDIGHVEIRQT